MKFIERLLLALLILFLLVSVAVAILFTSPAGLHATLWLVQQSTPGELTVAGVKGRLLDRFAFSNLRYEADELNVQLHEFSIDWQPLALFQGTLTIDRLAADTIDITLPPGENSDTANDDITLPLTLKLQQMDIGELQLNSGDSQQTVRDIRLDAYTQGDVIFIDSFSLTGDFNGTAVALSAAGHVTLNQPWSHELESEFSVQLPEQPLIEGNASSHGDTRKLTAAVNTTTPDRIAATLNARDILNNPQWQATLQSADVDLSPWLDSATHLAADLKASGNSTHVTAQLEAALTGDIEQAMTANTDIKLDDSRSFTIEKLQLHNPTQSLHLALQGDVDYGDDLNLDIDGDWSIERPQPIAGQVALTGSLENYQLQLTAGSSEPMVSSWQLDARGNQHSLTIEQLNGELAQGKLQAGGKVDWSETPNIRLDGNWQNIVIPLRETEQLKSPQGEFNIEGDLENYRITSNGRVVSAAIPSTSWQLQASGDQSQLTVDALTLALLEGRIVTSGKADWSTGTPLVTADVELGGINPGAHWTDWPGRLNGVAHIAYQPPDEGQQNDWQATIKDLKVHGRLRDYPLNAKGTAVLGADDYRIHDLQIKVADSTLLADGSLAKNSQLNFSLNSPDLGQLLPEAGGKMDVEGQLSGNYQAPHLRATINASQVRTPWLDLAAVTAETDIDATDNRFSLAIDASDLQRDGHEIEKITIDSNGQLNRHTIDLDIKTADRQLSLAGTGSWQNESWSLNLDQGKYRDSDFGTWQLAQPLQLTLGSERIEAPEHCWQQQPAQLCMAADWLAAGAWQGRIDLQDYRIDAEKTDTLPVVSGDITFSLQASGQAGELQQTSGDIRLSNVSIKTDTETELRISQLDVDLTGNNDGVQLTLDGEFAEPAPGNLKGRIETGAIRFDAIEQTGLAGQLNADIDNLQPWLELYPRFIAEQAELTADFAIGGEIGNPSLDGNLQLEATDFGIPELGITINTLALNITGQPQRGLALKGRAESGPGSLNIDGRIAIESGNVVVPDMTIKGEHFELLNLPEITAQASPDLKLQYRDNLLKVTGEVTIPEALIQPFGAVDTIPVSDDEIIVKDGAQQDRSDIDIDARIKLILGDNVRVTGRGFESRLVGTLDISQAPGKLPSANGELRLVDGGYRAYGQELDIQTGEIIFTNQPIDNPALNISAVRNIKDITVGVRASGTAEQPQTELFSTPTMPEAEILSYLITGRPLSDAGAGDGNALLSAAASMGLKKTESLQQTIANTLGLDTLSVDTGTTSTGETGASLTIGKYLAPNLYISYGAGLVETAVNTVKLRYEINRHLSLEAEQGAGTGVDLLYQIESGDPWK